MTNEDIKKLAELLGKLIISSGSTEKMAAVADKFDDALTKLVMDTLENAKTTLCKEEGVSLISRMSASLVRMGVDSLVATCTSAPDYTPEGVRIFAKLALEEAILPRVELLIQSAEEMRKIRDACTTKVPATA